MCKHRNQMKAMAEMFKNTKGTLFILVGYLLGTPKLGDTP